MWVTEICSSGSLRGSICTWMTVDKVVGNARAYICFNTESHHGMAGEIPLFTVDTVSRIYVGCGGWPGAWPAMRVCVGKGHHDPMAGAHLEM